MHSKYLPHAQEQQLVSNIMVVRQCSARNNVQQLDNFRTILHISGQFNYCPDIVSEQLRGATLQKQWHFIMKFVDGLWVTRMLKDVPFNQTLRF